MKKGPASIHSLADPNYDVIKVGAPLSRVSFQDSLQLRQGQQEVAVAPPEAWRQYKEDVLPTAECLQRLWARPALYEGCGTGSPHPLQVCVAACHRTTKYNHLSKLPDKFQKFNIL